MIQIVQSAPVLEVLSSAKKSTGGVAAMKFHDIMQRRVLYPFKKGLALFMEGVSKTPHDIPDTAFGKFCNGIKRIAKFIVGLIMVIGSLPLLPIVYLLTRISALFLPDFIEVKPNIRIVDQAQNDKDSMKLMTYNVGAGPAFMCAANGLREPLQRVDGVVDKICKSNADVVCLQEVFDEEFAEALIKKLQSKKYKYFVYRAGKTGSFWQLNSGLMIASKTLITQPEFYQFKNGVGEDSLAKKGLLKTTIKGINVFNTHLQAGGHNPKATARINAHTKQMEAIKQKITLSNKAVIAGDFNIGPNLKKLWKAKANFLNTYQDRLLENYSETKPCGSFINMVTGKIEPYLIDFIRFFENGTNVWKNECQPTSYSKLNGNHLTDRVSDHIPIIATFKLN